MIDFTNCRQVLGRAYNGANGKKIAVEYNHEVYMLKFPPSGENKPTELSYTNSCISEHIACHIFNQLGIPAQETLLGTYRVAGKEKIVCACKDFTVSGKRLLDFCSIKNTVLDSESGGNGTELADILDTIEKQQFVSPDKLLAHFWDMFVGDALVGNFDRHNGNWGFLFDEQTNETTIAPVYDCGSCLLPQADESVMHKVLTDENERNARIFHFPTSAVRQNGKKINYYDFLTTGQNQDCAEAVKRIVPKFDADEIQQWIKKLPYITKLQKDFYSQYVGARYELILQPALTLVYGNAEQHYDGPSLHM